MPKRLLWRRLPCAGRGDIQSIRRVSNSSRWYDTPWARTASTQNGPRRPLRPTEPHDTRAWMAATQQWIDRIVVGQKLCPFVQPLKSSNTLRLTAVPATNLLHVVQAVHDEVRWLVSDTNDGPEIGGRDGTHAVDRPIVSLSLDALSARNHGPHQSPSCHNDDQSMDETDTDGSSSTDVSDSDSDSDDDVSDAVDDDDEDVINHLEPDPTRSILHKARATLIVMKGPLVDDYMDFKNLWITLMQQVVYQHAFQNEVTLWIFHPLAVHSIHSAKHAHMPAAAAADYTMRSPHPVVLVMRAVDWQYFQSMASVYPPMQELSPQNQMRFQSQGLQQCRQRLHDCYSIGGPTAAARDE